jgi:hypothetical protein
MPETGIDEHGNSNGREDYVRLPPQGTYRSAMNVIAHAVPM